MDQFQRQLQDLEAAKKIFVNKCPAAPHLPGVVKAEFQESDRAQAIALTRDYGLEAKFIDDIELTKITVPAGRERVIHSRRKGGLFLSEIRRHGVWHWSS
jgi:hypothetical protein